MSVTDTLPPDARCLLLVIHRNEYSFDVEPCEKNMYALRCKYALLKCIYQRVLVSVFIKKTAKGALKNGQSRYTGNN
jgi:hypothetical protein